MNAGNNTHPQLVVHPPALTVEVQEGVSQDILGLAIRESRVKTDTAKTLSLQQLKNRLQGIGLQVMATRLDLSFYLQGTSQHTRTTRTWIHMR